MLHSILFYLIVIICGLLVSICVFLGVSSYFIDLSLCMCDDFNHCDAIYVIANYPSALLVIMAMHHPSDI